ncbi:hypothetical protein EX30DRAFT_393231, partial [Ascodesmis nigricans]
AHQTPASNNLPIGISSIWERLPTAPPLSTPLPPHKHPPTCALSLGHLLPPPSQPIALHRPLLLTPPVFSPPPPPLPLSTAAVLSALPVPSSPRRSARAHQVHGQAL